MMLIKCSELTDITKSARKALPLRVQATRSFAEFLEASGSLGTCAEVASLTRLIKCFDAPSEYTTPSKKLRNTEGSVSGETTGPSTSIERSGSSGSTTPFAIFVSSSSSSTNSVAIDWSSEESGESKPKSTDRRGGEIIEMRKLV